MSARAAAPASLLTLAGLAGLAVATRRAAGELVYPLDDTYIHMGVARTLAEHGTWGVNPGEFASASSSPLWTALLAAVFAVTGPVHALPALLNVACALGLLLLGARWLQDEGADDRSAAIGLVAVALAMPLPFVAALGMEHVLQLVTALLLIRATERGHLVPMVAAAAVAVLTRYESAFLAGWLAVFLVAERRIPAALATAGGAGGAIVGFGLWSVAQGGLFLPNSVLKKAALTGGGGIGAFDEAGPVLVLVAAVAMAAASSGPAGGWQRRARLFVLVALTHLAFARVGWFWRYEAWLVGWGALALVTPVRASGRGAALVVGAVAVPLGLRAFQALTSFAAGAQLHADVDVALARWVGTRWPDATVAVHDLGAMAWYTDAEIVDVGGIGTDAITRPWLDGTLTPASVGAVMRDQGVALAITGPRWLQGDPPPGVQRVATLTGRYGAGEHDTVVWSVGGDRAALIGSISPADFSGRVRVRVEDALALDLAGAALEGPAVQLEEGWIAFYTNGRAEMAVPAGELAVVARGAMAEGRGPRFVVRVGDRTQAFEVVAEQTFPLGAVGAGDRVVIEYADDVIDAGGADRNLFVRLSSGPSAD